MPTPFLPTSKKLDKNLRELGQHIRDYRKQLGLSSVVTAEAASMSRTTLFRIEKGEASVAISAYLSVIMALGLTLSLLDSKNSKQKTEGRRQIVPSKIRIANYKQLKRLAWQLKDTKTLSPKDALDLYERNWRHVDIQAMEARERELIENLLKAFERKRLLV